MSVIGIFMVLVVSGAITTGSAGEVFCVKEAPYSDTPDPIVSTIIVVMLLTTPPVLTTNAAK